MRRMPLLYAGILAVVSGCAGRPRAIDWSFATVMPQAKSARATAAVGHRIVTVGGTWWETLSDQTKVKHWLRGVEMLDTRDMTWSKLPDYPFEAGYAFAAAAGHRVFACGGRSADRGNNETFILDLSASEPVWQPGPPLPKPRWGHVGGAIGSTIYVVGGFEGDPSKKDGSQRATDVIALDTTDLDAGWRSIPDAPAPGKQTAWVTAATCAGKLYLFCEATDEAFAFDPANATWRQIASPPIGLSSGAATNIDDRYVLLAGGSAKAIDKSRSPDGSGRNYIAAECYLYDPTTDRYTGLTRMRQAVLDQGLVYIDGAVYSLGGEESPHKSRTDLVQAGRLR